MAGIADKFWISVGNRHIFALWLQAQITFFGTGVYSEMYMDMSKYYKRCFSELDLNSGLQPTSIEVAYDSFVGELVQAVN